MSEWKQAPTPGRRIRNLLDAGVVVAPGVYDGMTAVLAERAGFEAAFLTGAGVSYTTLARGDRGYVGLGEMLHHAGLVTRASSIPVLADADTGYGNAVNVIHTVREFERVGVAGVQLEDQPLPKKCAFYSGIEVLPVEEMVAKLRAACDGRRDPDFVVIARTDARAADGLPEALRRVRAYEEAGADVVVVEALEDEAEMRAVVEAVSVPVMAAMVEGAVTPNLPVADLARIGFRLVVHPNSVTRAAAWAMAQVLDTIRAHGTSQPWAPQMMSYDQISAVVGADADRETELRYTPVGAGSPGAPGDRA